MFPKSLEPSSIFDDKENTVRMTLKSGDVFEGNVSNWIPHGQGRLFRGGTTYEVIQMKTHHKKCNDQ